MDDKKSELFKLYPQFNMGLTQGKVRKKEERKNVTVGIRSEKFNEIQALWKRLNEKYYLTLEDIPESELETAVLSILQSGIKENLYTYTVRKSVAFNKSEAYVHDEPTRSQKIEEKISYGEFLRLAHQSTGLPLNVMHKALCAYSLTASVDDLFFNKKTLEKVVEKFQAWFESAFLKRFSYKALGIERQETALTDFKGQVKERIMQGVVGISRDSDMKVPDNFLYDQVVFDSPKEKENIQNSEIDEVVVFGKIPRKSIQVPLYFGGTTSPDFMYVVKKESGYEVNLIVETKDIDRVSTLRGTENLKIESAKKFFDALKDTGLNVVFKPQLKADDIVPMIKSL